MMYLIYCDYDTWCQGWEPASGYFLVEANSFEHACEKLQGCTTFTNKQDFRNFDDCTVK